MTSVLLEQDLPSVSPFLNSVCPGFSFLDHNVIYSIKDKVFHNGEDQLSWLMSSNSSNTVAKLNNTYLNVARPPLSSHESTTYVSLPYHVTNLFKQVVDCKDKQSEGNMHIGANVNPLSQDPFKLVDLTPGCLTNILEVNEDPDAMSFSNLSSSVHHTERQAESKNPFNKITNNFNKLLKFTTSESHAQPHTSYPRLSHLHEDQSSLIDKLISYNRDTFLDELTSSTTSKLLISSHVNILNVFTIDNYSNYKNSKDVWSKVPNTPYKDDLQVHEGRNNSESTNSAAASIATNSNSIKEYKRTIEEPLLRVMFREGSVITALKTFVSKAGVPIIILGFESGEIIIINLIHLSYQIFDNLDVNGSVSVSVEESKTPAPSNGNISVTAFDVIDHHAFDFLIIAGFSNGEVAILNAFGNEKASAKKPAVPETKYQKRVVGRDSCATYFKKFNLSPFEDIKHPVEDNSPDYLIGHFKVSHKPITAISSTLPYNWHTNTTAQNPALIAIACDDGFVRFLDLVFSFNLHREPEEVDQQLGHKSHIFTDVLSNYFNDGIRDVQFSPDFRFLCVVGKGDLIEIFKMTYLNVNGLIHKNNSGIGRHQSHTSISAALSLNTATTTQGKRSRSGTLNSLTSSTQPTTMNSLFLAPNPPTNFPDLQRSSEALRATKETFPPITKDIRIVGRFKGHTNTVKGIRFIQDSDKREGATSAPSTYRMISYGYDGKIFLWEFDYKAVSKFKKLAHTSDGRSRNKSHDKGDNKKSDRSRKKRSSRPPRDILSHTASPSRKSTPTVSANATMKNLHARSRSVTKEEFSTPMIGLSSPTLNALSTSLNSMANGGASLNRILSNVSNEELGQAGEYHTDIVINWYQSIYALRYKRHYKSLTKGSKKVGNNDKYGAIFHPIVTDKEVPSFEIPLLSIDLSSLLHDGKVDGFYLDEGNFWCFGKNGDIFRYVIENN